MTNVPYVPVMVAPPVAEKVMLPGVPVGVLLSVMLLPEIDVTVVALGILVPVTAMPTAIWPLILVRVIWAVLALADTITYLMLEESLKEDDHELAKPSLVPFAMV